MSSQNQAAFTHVVEFLRAQGRPAIWNSSCVYRHPDGLKCAIGCLISDHVYTPQLEGFAIASEHKEDLLIALEESGWGDVDLDLLSKLQWTHDECSEDRWEYHWKDIAEEYELEMP